MATTVDQNTSARTGAAQPATPNHKWWALAATCFGLFMALLDITVVNVALPTIQRGLHANLADLQWVISSYTLALAVFLVTAGRLGDIFGRKRVFMAGLAIFTLGSLLCGLSSTITIGSISHIDILFAARAIQGLGGSVMLPLSLAIISSTFQGPQRGTAIGIWGGVTGLSTAIGPLVGGVLVDKVSWESIFFVNVPIGVIGLAMAAWAIRESRDTRAPRSIDLIGLVAITISMFCLVLALIQANDADKGWTSGYILTLFGIAAVAMIAFVVVELRLANPMVDPRLFKNASFTGGAAIAAFALSAGLYSLLFYLTLYFQNFLGFSALDAGLRFLPFSLPVLVAAPLAGALTHRVGARTFIVSGLVLNTIAVLLMMRISPHDHQVDWVVLLLPFLLAGIGGGIINPPISSVAVGTVSGDRAGMASGVSGTCRQVGIAFGIALLGAILTTQYNSYVKDRVPGAVASLNLAAYHVPASQRPAIISGAVAELQAAGPVAGSAGLRGAAPSGQASRYQNTPLSRALQPALGQIGRASFVDSTVDILKVAAAILAIGALFSLVLVKKSDMLAEEAGEAMPAAG